MSTIKKSTARAAKKEVPATGVVSTKAKKGESVKVRDFIEIFLTIL